MFRQTLKLRLQLNTALAAVVSTAMLFGSVCAALAEEQAEVRLTERVVSLPPPKRTGKLSLEESIAARRSVRRFKNEPLTKEVLSQLLWSLQGVTNSAGFRTAPSAGPFYPLEIYVALRDGLYYYDPEKNVLFARNPRDLRAALCKAAMGQDAIKQAPAIFVVTAVYERTAARYGEKRAERYVLLECGHAAQNLLLQAVSLGLGAVPIGAFQDVDVVQVLGLPANEKVIYLIPVGYAR